MALTQEIKFKVVMLLGYPSGVIIDGNKYYNRHIVENLAALPVELEPELTILLNRLKTTDDQLSSGLANAGVKRIDDIEFFENGLQHLRDERRKILSQLSNLFGIPMNSDANGYGSSMGNVCIG